MSTALNYELSDGIATLTMDDGKANALGLTMLAAINAGLDRAEADKAAVVVIAGRDKMFSGGFDLAAFKRSPTEVVEMLGAGALLAQRLLSFRVPVVAAATGHAVAMGSFLLLSCDARIGANVESKFHINEVAIGMILPFFAIEICRQRLTSAAMTQAVILATPMNGPQAMAAGILDEVVAPEAVLSRARERAMALKALVPGAHTATKLRIRQPALEALKAAIAQDNIDWKAAFTPN